MGLAWVDVRVGARHEWAPGLFTLVLDRPPPPFEAGQFLQLGLDVDGQPRDGSYSLASAPGEPAEFFVREVTTGRFSPALAALRPGDPLRMGPKAAGHFTLGRVPPGRELWMFATGTGLGPYVAMLRTEEPWARFERLIVVHGVRHPVDLAYRDELLARSAAHGGRLTWVPLISGPAAPPAGALGGRIPDALADGRLEARAGARLDPERSQTLLCGNPAMLEAVAPLLEARGLRKNRARAPGHITAEPYW